MAVLASEVGLALIFSSLAAVAVVGPMVRVLQEEFEGQCSRGQSFPLLSCSPPLPPHRSRCALTRLESGLGGRSSGP